MTEELRVEARAFRPGDERLLAALPGTAERVEELRWRYGTAPHGACVALALSPDDRARAAVFATRQRVRFEGRESHWLEVGHLWNDFEHAKGLARGRAALAAGKVFAETFGGLAPEKHPVMYGRPTRRAHRLGLRAFEWEVLRSENELARRVQGPPQSPPDVEVRDVKRFTGEVNGLFERWVAARPAALVRDEFYLNWRYADRAGFCMAVAHRAQEVVGLAVLRAGELHDLLAEPGDELAFRALLVWACARAQASGARELTAIVPDSAPEWLLFQREGFRVRGTRDYLCFRSFQRPAIMSWLFQHWSYSRGDLYL